MAKTVYVLGAGVNMVVRHGTRHVRPPLARDFFRQLHRDLNREELVLLRDKNSKLYEYIEQHWGLGFDDLSTEDFDLEECFTRLEQQEEDASRRQEVAGAYTDTWEIKGQLTASFAGLLNEISSNQPPGEEGLGPLARRVLDEGAAIATFNYDTLLEQAMIQESGRSWDPIPAYSAPFDFLEPRNGAPLQDFRFDKSPSQAHAALFLKLHGSLNWFRVAGGGGDPVEEAPGRFVQRHERLGQTLVRPVGGPAATSTTGHTFVTEHGTLLEQLIITPVLHKNVAERPFGQLWRVAQDEMRGCSRLVVCGYSFPRTDEAARRLFSESFAGCPPDELVVINPDESVARQVKDLCHFDGSVRVCGDLEEYLAR